MLQEVHGAWVAQVQMASCKHGPVPLDSGLMFMVLEDSSVLGATWPYALFVFHLVEMQ